MLRAFRVFRLFKRIKSLNEIIVSLGKVRRATAPLRAQISAFHMICVALALRRQAVPGVINAFVIMSIVMAIFAMISVDAYARFGESGTYITEQQMFNETSEYT
jgi:hypothetical protein